MNSSQVISLVFGIIGGISWASIAYDKVQHRLGRTENDLNGVAQINRRIIGNHVRDAKCAKHEDCVKCAEKRDQAARLIEGR